MTNIHKAHHSLPLSASSFYTHTCDDVLQSQLNRVGLPDIFTNLLFFGERTGKYKTDFNYFLEILM